MNNLRNSLPDQEGYFCQKYGDENNFKAKSKGKKHESKKDFNYKSNKKQRIREQRKRKRMLRERS